MKKPEPWAMLNWRPRGIFGMFGMFGIPGPPKRRKNCSSDEPGGNGRSSLLNCICSRCETASALTRTPITAGFTRSTMSAKPTGRAAFSALTWAAAVDGKEKFVGAPGPANKAAAPRPATVASKTIRRADKIFRGAGGVLVDITSLSIGISEALPARRFDRRYGEHRLTASCRRD